MSVEVLKPGLLTTIQDRGRAGCAALGVGRAGAMDDVALRLANALVGNDDDDAALEIALAGPTLRFDRAARIAITGADLAPTLDGDAVPGWRIVDVAAGATLAFRAARRGRFAYLAVAGGFAVERVLGSASSDVNGGIGPLGGRALVAGDVLGTGRPADTDGGEDASDWSLDPRPWFDGADDRVIRFVRGSHFDALDARSRDALRTRTFAVASDSNRVGFRLDGMRLALARAIELVSEPVAAGTLQLPPSGQPIALMAEHPTVGGYPRIGQIAAIDLPRLAQRRSGDRVRFEEIALDDAQTRYLRREREIAELIGRIRERIAR